MLPGLSSHGSTLAQNLLQPWTIATFILHIHWPSIILCGHTHSDSHPGFHIKLHLLHHHLVPLIDKDNPSRMLRG